MKEYKKIEKKYIYERDNGSCRFCGKDLLLKKITLDHYLPRSEGGPDDTFNLVLCCKKCNKLKKSNVPDDYEAVMIELFKRAVRDKKIIGSSLGIRHDELIALTEQINKVEHIGEYVVFQSKGKRFYVDNNKVFKIVQLSGAVYDQ